MRSKNALQSCPLTPRSLQCITSFNARSEKIKRNPSFGTYRAPGNQSISHATSSSSWLLEARPSQRETVVVKIRLPLIDAVFFNPTPYTQADWGKEHDVHSRLSVALQCPGPSCMTVLSGENPSSGHRMPVRSGTTLAEMVGQMVLRTWQKQCSKLGYFGENTKNWLVDLGHDMARSGKRYDPAQGPVDAGFVFEWHPALELGFACETGAVSEMWLTIQSELHSSR
jgi:hypothetical protein